VAWKRSWAAVCAALRGRPTSAWNARPSSPLARGRRALRPRASRAVAAYLVRSLQEPLRRFRPAGACSLRREDIPTVARDPPQPRGQRGRGAQPDLRHAVALPQRGDAGAPRRLAASTGGLVRRRRAGGVVARCWPASSRSNGHVCQSRCCEMHGQGSGADGGLLAPCAGRAWARPALGDRGQPARLPAVRGLGFKLHRPSPRRGSPAAASRFRLRTMRTLLPCSRARRWPRPPHPQRTRRRACHSRRRPRPRPRRRFRATGWW
jgi:hypothetical protein